MINLEKYYINNVENKLDTTIDGYTDVYGDLELNGLQRNLSKTIQEGQKKIASNTNQIDNPILKKTSELLPSTANSLVGAGISAVNPYLGMSYFIISASGSYETEGRNRGMTKDEATSFPSSVTRGISFLSRFSRCEIVSPSKFFVMLRL